MFILDQAWYAKSIVYAQGFVKVFFSDSRLTMLLQLKLRGDGNFC
jgi:hypothetical protein